MAATSQTEKFTDYDGFVSKFQPKKTTDDCYTPEAVYGAVLGWIRKEYGLPPETVICRPFWPGADYQTHSYPDECVVVDNPPFSLYSKIVRFFLTRGIRFFLFCPSLTAIVAHTVGQVCYIICDSDIAYANGARVRTAFATNLEPQTAIRTAPELRAALKEAQKSTAPELPKYSYPDSVLTAANFQRLAPIDFSIAASDVIYVPNIDAMRAAKKSAFGGCYLLSERAAAERAAAERAAAERAAAVRWQLSERELKLIQNMRLS